MSRKDWTSCNMAFSSEITLFRQLPRMASLLRASYVPHIHCDTACSCSSKSNSRPGGDSEGCKDSLSSQLIFPASMSKSERESWHKCSERHNLKSRSEGFGDGRYLVISGREGEVHPQETARAEVRGLADAREGKALQIYKWCMDEGGDYLRYSRNEILQIIDSKDWPADLIRLCGKRLKGRQVFDALKKGDEKAALDRLKLDRSLAWLRDDESGAYPLHLAASTGLDKVVAYITKQPSTIQQRDRERRTPLQVARRQQQAGVAGILEALGAPEFGPGT